MLHLFHYASVYHQALTQYYNLSPMREAAISTKPRSKTLSTEALASPSCLSLSSKTSQILKVQSQIRKLKHLVSMQQPLQYNRQEFQSLNSQIVRFEDELKTKRQEVQSDKMLEYQRKKQERQMANKQSNDVLSRVKGLRRQRRQKMESLISMYKEEYDLLYEKKLKQKREQMKFGIDSLREHEQQYLKVAPHRRNIRVKTQNTQRFLHQPDQTRLRCPHLHPEPPSLNQKETRLLEIRELVRRRREYGQNAQKLSHQIRIPIDLINKVRGYKGGAEDGGNSHPERKLEKKARLNTNLQGDLERLQDQSIEKMVGGQSPVKDKLAMLKSLADGYLLKYQNGDELALEKMSNISLKRADLLLSDI